MKTLLFNSSFFLVLFLPVIVGGQNIIVTGYVTDEKKGNYLENVNIFESNSVIGTLTDKNGFYHLMLPLGTINLTATLSGFQHFSKQIVVERDTVLSIHLKPVTDPKGTVKKENQQEASRDVRSHSRRRLFRND